MVQFTRQLKVHNSAWGWWLGLCIYTIVTDICSHTYWSVSINISVLWPTWWKPPSCGEVRRSPNDHQACSSATSPQAQPPLPDNKSLIETHTCWDATIQAKARKAKNKLTKPTWKVLRTHLGVWGACLWWLWSTYRDTMDADRVQTKGDILLLLLLGPSLSLS